MLVGVYNAHPVYDKLSQYLSDREHLIRLQSSQAICTPCGSCVVIIRKTFLMMLMIFSYGARAALAKQHHCTRYFSSHKVGSKTDFPGILPWVS